MHTGFRKLVTLLLVIILLISILPSTFATTPDNTENIALSALATINNCTMFDMDQIIANNFIQPNVSSLCSLATTNHDDYGNDILEIGVSNAMVSNGTAQVRYYFVTNGTDLSAFAEDGAVTFSLWSNSSTTITVEIGSSSNNDNQEIQWSGITISPGWNQISLEIADGNSVGSSSIDLSSVVRFRLFCNSSITSTFLLTDISMYHYAYLPGNTTGDAQQDITIAKTAVQDHLGTSPVDVHISNTASDSETFERIIFTVDELIAQATASVDNIYNVSITTTCTQSTEAHILFEMDGVTDSMTVPISITTYTPQVPQIVTSIFAGDEIITAEIVLNQGSYTLDATGENDCTAVIQTALNDCAYNGGGVVWLPAGYYRVTGQLVIPAYVTLRGDWQDPDSVTNNSDRHYGTILIADIPSNNNDPLIYMSGSTGVRGLTIYYPQQNLSNPIQNSYAIYNEGRAISKTDRGLHNIQDITIINAYKGIGICDTIIDPAGAATSNAEQTYISNIKGTFLKTGLYNFNASDNGGTIGFSAKASYWTDFLSSPAYTKITSVITPAQVSVTDSQINTYTLANAIGLHIGDLESDYFTDVSINGYKYGVRVSQGARTTYYGDFFNFDITNCETGIQFDKLSGFGVNIACSDFTNNTTDIRNNSNVPVKLTKVNYNTLAGSSILTTSDDTLIETFSTQTMPEFGTTDDNFLVFNPNSTSSVSAQLQSALNQIAQQGGGIVYVPAGTYTLTQPITIPTNTELRGCAGSAVKPAIDVQGGTILEITFGHNVSSPQDNAAITLTGNNAGVSGVIIVYPSQTPNTPVTTGYAICGENADNCFVVNTSILAFSHGIYLENCDGYVVDGITFANFNNNITTKNCVGGKISRCLQNLSTLIRTTYNYETWETMESGTNTPAFTFTSGHLNCLIFDGSTNQSVMHWYAYRPHDTITLRNGASVTAINYGAGGASVDDVGVLISAESASSQMLSINSHQKNRYTVDNPFNANVRAYNRMTLHVATLVTAEDNYRSTGSDNYVLLEPNVSLCSNNATTTGYNLSNLGSISFATNYPAYTDSYDFSEYSVIALDINTVITSGGTFEMSLNDTTIPFDAYSSGEQTIYLDINQFGNNLSTVNISSFAFEVKTAISPCVLYRIRLLKELPAGTSFTPSSLNSPKKILVDPNTVTTTNASTVSISNAPSATELLSSSSIWTATSSRPILTFNFDSVDISAYQDDGYLHFYLYVPQSAANAIYRVELSSSGAADSKELQFEFGANSEYFDIALSAGWNEIWLPLIGGHTTGFIDHSAVNYIRFYSKATLSSSVTIYLDGFEVVHRPYIDQGIANNSANTTLWNSASDLTASSMSGSPEIISLSAYRKTGYGLHNAATQSSSPWVSASYTTNTVKHLAHYGGGYLHCSLYIKDTASLASLTTMTFELTSSGKADSREFQWVINNARTTLSVGWNEIYFPLSRNSDNLKSSYADLNRINFFRLFYTNNGTKADLILADMYATMVPPTSIPSGSLLIIE